MEANCGEPPSLCWLPRALVHFSTSAISPHSFSFLGPWIWGKKDQSFCHNMPQKKKYAPRYTKKEKQHASIPRCSSLQVQRPQYPKLNLLPLFCIESMLCKPRAMTSCAYCRQFVKERNMKRLRIYLINCSLRFITGVSIPLVTFLFLWILSDSFCE